MSKTQAVQYLCELQMETQGCFTSSLSMLVGSGGSCLEALHGRRGFLGGRWGWLRQLSVKEKQKQKADISICMKRHSEALCLQRVKLLNSLY